MWHCEVYHATESFLQNICSCVKFIINQTYGRPSGTATGRSEPRPPLSDIAPRTSKRTKIMFRFRKAFIFAAVAVFLVRFVHISCTSAMQAVPVSPHTSPPSARSHVRQRRPMHTRLQSQPYYETLGPARCAPDPGSPPERIHAKLGQPASNTLPFGSPRATCPWSPLTTPHKHPHTTCSRPTP